MYRFGIETIEKIYAGWLAKIIGIRLGAPVESWTYERIRSVYGEPDGYLTGYRNFAADDDSNGPLFFLRALQDKQGEGRPEPGDVADALLNYAPYEHGFFWWGGYGISTEHTAYLNLQNGIGAPRSGSIAQNGAVAAEQIGGQIFSDAWGLVSPGNPKLAAELARTAASVTHDGNGVYGGMFVAGCISWAFAEQDMERILEKGLSLLPGDCAYAGCVSDILRYYRSGEGGWKDCLAYIHANYGYDRYPGVCHIIPNCAVMILALLYGEGDFDDTLNICNRCGWDTDCNVGNVATIMGVRGGVDVIEERKWRLEINDLLICSSVIGSLNIMDIPYGASYIARQAFRLAGEELPEGWDKILGGKDESGLRRCHFEYPGSTHGLRVRTELPDGSLVPRRETRLRNTQERVRSGRRSLKASVKDVLGGESIYLYKQIYYEPEDFDDSRYDPAFSPLLYPGQTIYGSVFLPESGVLLKACLYAKDVRGSVVYRSEMRELKRGEWADLSFTLPEDTQGVLLKEAGVLLTAVSGGCAVLLLDDFYWEGKPRYLLDFAREREEIWPGGLHREISQCTRYKGLAYLEQGRLHVSGADDAAVYTGFYEWTDYRVHFNIIPCIGDCHLMLVRVQGAGRSYAAGLMPDGRLALLKNEKGWRILAQADYPWRHGREYRISVTVRGSELRVDAEGGVQIVCLDEERPWMTGGVGIGTLEGSHVSCGSILVEG